MREEKPRITDGHNEPRQRTRVRLSKCVSIRGTLCLESRRTWSVCRRPLPHSFSVNSLDNEDFWGKGFVGNNCGSAVFAAYCM